MNENISFSDEELRQLQLNELEMLVEVDRICKKNNIKYSLDGGTLLGAIRHKGFIPWDDDVDVTFTRTEYEKFYQSCKKDLKKDLFFFQEYRTDPYYRWGFSKLRRLNTEFIREGQEHMKYKTGVNIDVFIVDNVPNNPIFKRLYWGISFLVRKIMYSEVGMKNEEKVLLRMCYKVLHLVPRNVGVFIINTITGICNKKETNLVGHLSFPYAKRSRFGMPSECFDEYTELEFEGMKFGVVKNYDLYLSSMYGDYMKLPPEEERHPALNHTAVKMKLIDISLEEIKQRYLEENAIYTK